VEKFPVQPQEPHIRYEEKELQEDLEEEKLFTINQDVKTLLESLIIRDDEDET
jgi:hypothetical protein